MNNFCDLIGFEYKKIFKSKMNVIFLCLALFISIGTSFLNSYGADYYSGIGNEISASQALKQDRKIINKNKGYVSEEVIRQTIILAQEGIANKDNYFFNNGGKEVLKPESQVAFVLPYSNIYRFLNNIYNDKFETKGIEKPIQYIIPGDMDRFYGTYKGFLDRKSVV